MRWPWRTLVAAILLAAMLGWSGAVPETARAATARAVVIVDTGSEVRKTTISFSGTVSGIEALVLAGANPETIAFGGTGAAVCRLYGVGHNPNPSTCLGTASDPRYWAYHRSPAGSEGFSYSGTGAGAIRVGDGDVEGWKFGKGEAPPYSSFCSAADCAGSGPASGGAVSAGGSGGSASATGAGADGGAADAQGAASAPAADGATSEGTGPGRTVGRDATETAGQQDRVEAIAHKPGPPESGIGGEESQIERRSVPIPLIALAVLLVAIGAAAIRARRKSDNIGRSQHSL